MVSAGPSANHSLPSGPRAMPNGPCGPAPGGTNTVTQFVWHNGGAPPATAAVAPVPGPATSRPTVTAPAARIIFFICSALLLRRGACRQALFEAAGLGVNQLVPKVVHAFSL